MSLNIQGVSVITLWLEGWENESPRIRGGIATHNKLSSLCHLLNSSQSFSLFKGLSGLGHRGVIQRVNTNPDITSIIRTSGIEPMIVIGSEGC